MSAVPETAPAPDAMALLQELNTHALLLRSLSALAEYGIADRLAPGPRTAAELAAGAKLDADVLYRVLRFTASCGIFREDAEHRFHLTPLAEALRTEARGSIRDRLRRPWQDILWRSYERLPDMVRTGENAFALAHGESFFDYLAVRPEMNAMFDRSMARLSSVENSVIAAAYPFGRYGWVVDVGGGQGGLLAAVLEQHPAVHGVLYDQPQVIAAPEALAAGKFTGRWEAVAGDFFRTVPPGGDLYVLKRIVHDWDDDRALAILRNCREALRGDGRLVVVDALMQAGNEPDHNKFMDVNIMALMSGRERTEQEFRRLFGEAGLVVERVAPLPAPTTLSIIEARLP